MTLQSEPADLKVTPILSVFEPPGNTPSNLVIRRSVTPTFLVAMEFEFVSPLAISLLGSFKYEIRYFADIFGPGADVMLGTVRKLTVPGQPKCSATLPVNQETGLTVPSSMLADGVYRLSAVVTFLTLATPPTPIAMTAFAEGPAIQVMP
ncbi:hypothetical protein GCM10009733_104820 [Nonomuraea maheshkhaliensis]|uniref:Uncharacterized protein n=1 Tax=Nonomuraea maheshkhaliensis TaxID=419590 RepID=A0ABN2HQJ2_9ACTN